MLTIECRPPTPAERAVAFPKGSVKSGADSVAWCMLPMLGLAGAGWVVQDIVRRAGGNIAPWLVVGGATLGAPLSAFLAWAWIRSSRESRKRRLDVVEVLRVRDARVVEMEEHNDEGPHYFFEVEPGTLLFLTGQWIFERVLADAGRDAPFPTAAFDLVRDPATGQVLALHPTGPKAPLLRTYRMDEVPLEADFPYAPAVLFEGNLDDLPVAVRRASSGDPTARP